MGKVCLLMVHRVTALLISGKLEWIKIQDDFHAQLKYVDNNGEVFYFHTNDNAPKGKVVRYNVEAQV
jgi:hypothetical protein